MRLAGKNKLEGLGGVKKMREPVRIIEDQLGAFVFGKAPRESDGEGGGIQQRSAGCEVCGGDLLGGPSMAGVLPDER